MDLIWLRRFGKRALSIISNRLPAAMLALVICACAVLPAGAVTQEHLQSEQLAPTTIVATVISPPARHKPHLLLYYFFHRGHRDAQQIAAANVPLPGPQLLLDIPASVQVSQPITVLLNPSEKPVTLIAYLGNKLVARSRMPAYTTRAVVSGLRLNGPHAPFTLVAKL